MAMVRSAMARVARSHQPASLPARAASELSLPSAGWRLQRRPAADHMTKRYLSDGKSECGLVDNLRQKYFKVDGCYHQVDTSVLMLHTANGIDAISKDLTAFKRKALVPAVCITTFLGLCAVTAIPCRRIWKFKKRNAWTRKMKLRISLIEHQRLGSPSPYIFVCHEMFTTKANRMMSLFTRALSLTNVKSIFHFM